MNDVSRLLAALQYGDSFFPSGAVSFSWGLETLSSVGCLTSIAELRGFLIGQIRGRWRDFDRAFIIAAHSHCSDLDHIASIDNTLELRTWASEMRSASRRTGEALLGVHKRLGTPNAEAYFSRVRSKKACGHSVVMQGFLWANAGLDRDTAVALSAHTLCVSLIGAAVRLGIATHIEAQLLFGPAQAEIERVCATPAPDLGEAAAFTPQSEIAIMQHEFQETRLFAN
jgi:urease accessory protein